MKQIPRIQDESNFELMRSFAPGEKETIRKVFEKAWRMRK